MSEYSRKEAVTCFNGTWDLIEKQNRTTAEDFEMIHKAHASCYHWSNVEGHTPSNLAAGEWQVSTVYSILKMGEVALYHAQRSLEICVENNVTDFNFAFSYEAIAKAYKVLGNMEEVQKNKDLGIAACETVEPQSEKDYTLSQLNLI